MNQILRSQPVVSSTGPHDSRFITALEQVDTLVRDLGGVWISACEFRSSEFADTSWAELRSNDSGASFTVLLRTWLTSAAGLPPRRRWQVATQEKAAIRADDVVTSWEADDASVCIDALGASTAEIKAWASANVSDRRQG